MTFGERGGRAEIAVVVEDSRVRERPAERPTIGLRDFLHVRETPGAHRVALRAGISVLVPQLVLLAMDRPEWSLYAAFGAFTSLYGRNHIHLSRLAMQASAGAALTVSVILGVLVGVLDSRAWAAVPVAAVVAAGGAMLSAAQDWHPPGSLFLVFAFGAVASFPHDLADVPIALLVTGPTVLFSLVVGNAGAYLRRNRRTEPPRLAPVLTWEPVRYVVAVLVSGSIATAIGIGHPYWAMVAAVAPLSARGITAQIVRAGHRMFGTVMGLVTSAALLALGMSPAPTVLTVAVLQILAELFVGRNYGLALLLVTPMALLMGQISAPRPTGELLFDRGVETAIGVVVGGLIILLVAYLRRRRPHPTPTSSR
jgi:hypothetical protein